MKTYTHFQSTAQFCALLIGLAACTASFAQTAPPASPTLTTAAPMPADEFLWLEDVQGERQLAWVRERNAVSTALLQAQPSYAPVRKQVFDALSATDKIPYVFRMGPHLYNLWTDASNKRGLLRRTTLAEYKKPQPAWETVLDIDALGAAEKENWVYKSISCARPSYKLCMLGVSRGGADATVLREFDVQTKAFVKDGFFVPEAKNSATWLNANTLLVGSDFGPGSMTASGYPRTVRQWPRGTTLAQAPTVWEGLPADVRVSVSVDHSVTPPRHGAGRSVIFWEQEVSMRQADARGDGTWQRLQIPTNMTFSTQGEWLFVQLRQDWTAGTQTYPAGSLLATKLAAFLAGERSMQVLFTPTPSTSLAGYALTQGHVLVNLLDNVAGRLVEWAMPTGQASWVQRELEALKANSKGNIGIASWHDASLGAADPMAHSYSINYADFLTPDSYFLAQAGSSSRELLKRLPNRFDATGMSSQQHFATSKDGTKVPYFLVLPNDTKPGKTVPTMLYGYGGFRQPQRPFYSATWGNAWLARGGAVVVANIRGGGEYGPAWHQSALKANKQRSYDDFIAIAEDLVKRGITTPKQLGIYGGSNGGLLTGTVALQRPDLFGAVISAVPLLDMRRYHLLLAGNSWMAEYGNPDIAAEWAYISQYSPYHNIKSGVKYPRMLFTTSTRDDRVHPAHARKMVARLQAMGHDVLYFENIEGGHGGAADLGQRADLSALQFAYLWHQLGQP